MSRPDLFPAGEAAFDLNEDRRDFRRAVLALVLVLAAVVVGTGVALWWLDRVATPPASKTATRPNWIPAPLHAERSFADLPAAR